MRNMGSFWGTAAVVLLAYLIAVVPAFYIGGSMVEALAVCMLLMVINISVADVIVLIGGVTNYFNPLKIVDGRYGMTNAWILISPIGGVLMGSVSVLVFFYNCVGVSSG